MPSVHLDCSNYSYYAFHPRSSELSSRDRRIATASTIAMGFCAPIIGHLVCGIVYKVNKVGIDASRSAAKTHTVRPAYIATNSAQRTTHERTIAHDSNSAPGQSVAMSPLKPQGDNGSLSPPPSFLVISANPDIVNREIPATSAASQGTTLSASGQPQSSGNISHLTEVEGSPSDIPPLSLSPSNKSKERSAPKEEQTIPEVSVEEVPQGRTPKRRATPAKAFESDTGWELITRNDLQDELKKVTGADQKAKRGSKTHSGSTSLDT